jgi:serine phosphatase RsbU (regulator of sigma subunit)
VGGDLFDIRQSGPDAFYVLIYDVSGHGIAAALVSAMARMSFENAQKQMFSPAAIMAHVNTDLCRLSEASMFVTAFVGRIDLKEKRLVYCRAGHCPPVRVSRNNTALPENLTAGGLVLGHRNDFAYSDAVLSLDTGDRLLFYTDGIIESRNSAGEFYGRERLHRFLGQTRTLALTDVRDALVQDVKTFAGRPDFDDDFTFILADI